MALHDVPFATATAIAAPLALWVGVHAQWVPSGQETMGARLAPPAHTQGLTRAMSDVRGAVRVSGGDGGASGRVALVVGNGAYAAENIPALRNPVNDAELMAEALETSGFEVRLVTDADQGAMRAAIEAFGEALERAGGDAVGLFYYAGHGVEVRGQNYLIPIGAEIAREVEFKTDAVPVDWVLSWMEAAGNRLNMVVLDACRNNPYEGRYRGASQGLAQMDAPSGSLIAYSAAPGQVAVDGEGENSPYTAAVVGQTKWHECRTSCHKSCVSARRAMGVAQGGISLTVRRVCLPCFCAMTRTVSVLLSRTSIRSSASHVASRFSNALAQRRVISLSGTWCPPSSTRRRTLAMLIPTSLVPRKMACVS